MKHLTILLLALAWCNGMMAQTKGYDIAVKVKPYKNAYVYLGYYYGKVRALADSVKLDAHSAGHFRGKEPLKGGIYFIVSPSKQILLELLIDKDQQFSVTADTASMPASIVFEGSTDNTQFQQYSAFAGEAGQQINALNQQAGKGGQQDSVRILPRIRALTRSLQHYRDSVIKSRPTAFLTTLFRAMNDPKIPPVSTHPGGKYDSNFVYEYYKAHYWDGISFADERLVRTPFFEPRLEKYFQDIVAPNPDSLIKEIDGMLLYARSAPEMFKYLMVHFVQDYINPKYMGQDAVFVHLFEKYINTGKAAFFTPQYKEFTARRAYSLMANLIGRPAADLDMVDSLGKPATLYSQQGEFTVVCFWDPTCSHCKDMVPRLDSMYNARWKELGVVLYGVKTDGSQQEWKKFIADHQLDHWVHVYQPDAKREEDEKAKRPGYKQLYDVYQTPVLYLLDKDKRIIAKKLTYQQIDEVIQTRLQARNK